MIHQQGTFTMRCDHGHPRPSDYAITSGEAVPPCAAQLSVAVNSRDTDGDPIVPITRERLDEWLRSRHWVNLESDPFSGAAVILCAEHAACTVAATYGTPPNEDEPNEDEPHIYHVFAGMALWKCSCSTSSPPPEGQQALDLVSLDALPACPECRDGKHGNCDGTTWDPTKDQRAPCPCARVGLGHTATLL